MKSFIFYILFIALLSIPYFYLHFGLVCASSVLFILTTSVLISFTSGYFVGLEELKRVKNVTRVPRKNK